MSRYVSSLIEPYVVPSSRFDTLRNLVAAAERGELPLSDVSSYIRASEDGEAVRFSRTRPALLAIAEAIRAAPSAEPRQTVYRGLADGLWQWEDVEVWEQNHAALSQARSAPRKGVYLTRSRRSRPHQPDVDGMFVPKMSLEAVCDGTISDGAKACLAVLMSLAGRGQTIVTYTSSIASRLGRTARSVRNYFIALEKAGLISRRPGKHPNTVVVTISPRCRPEPYVEPEPIRSFKLACRSTDPAIRMLAFTVSGLGASLLADETRLEEGRKIISAFNPESDSFFAATALEAVVPPRGDGCTSYSDLQLYVPPNRRWTMSGRSRPAAPVRSGDCVMRTSPLTRYEDRRMSHERTV